MQVARSTGEVVPHLVVPYSLDTNDMRFVQAQGFNTGDHFFNYLKDSFDALYAEGEDAPKMMSVGMQLPPARQAGAHRLAQALSSTMCRATSASGSAAASTSRGTGRRPIHSPRLRQPEPDMALTIDQLNAASPDEAVALLDGVYEHSPWVAARPFRRGRSARCSISSMRWRRPWRRRPPSSR